MTPTDRPTDPPTPEPEGVVPPSGAIDMGVSTVFVGVLAIVTMLASM